MMSQSVHLQAQAAQATPPAVDFDKPWVAQHQNDANDEDEWEYEYSTTESEVYYVTLDLYTPDLPVRHGIVKDDPNAPPKNRWTNPSYGTHGRGKGGITINPNAAPTFHVAGRKNPEREETDESEEEMEEEIASGDVNLASKKVQQVQILDLETDNPLVAYGGQFYSCQWASNIGTEMLFVEHDKKDPLPSLRSLPDNVDLIAASSARIISKHVSVKRDNRKRRFEDAEEEEELHNYKGIVDTWRDAAPHRKRQAKFLSELIQIKDDLGEEDMVSVRVSKRLSADKWRYEYWKIRKEEKATLQQIKKNNPNYAQAQEKLRRMEQEDAEDPLKDPEFVNRPDRGPGSRGGKSKVLQAETKKRNAELRAKGLLKRPGRPAKDPTKKPKKRKYTKKAAGPGAVPVFDAEPEDMSTPGEEISEQFSERPEEDYDQMDVIDEENEMPGDSRFEDADEDAGYEEEGYEESHTPNGGASEMDYDEESPSKQLLDDMGLNDEDAPGEDDDGY